LDNTVATTHPHTHETAVHAEHAHVSLPQHRHHFETVEQQREAGSFGMWLFLLTEIMFFGGLFFAYLLYRNWYYDAFFTASNQLSVPLGAVNTAFLIASGFFMALAVWAAEVRKKDTLVLTLILTTVFGVAFLSTTRNGRSITFRAPTSTSPSL
jgi:cytochrome c oxidase subunit 3